MKALWQEFKTFAFKGNMIDLAVGVVIGGAFGSVVKSMVDNIIMPMISYITPSTAYTDWHIGKIMVGKFMGDILSFLIVAAAVFIMIVKIVGMIMKKAAPPPPPSAPTIKECPYCLSNIPMKAKRCAHCASDLELVPQPS